MRRRSITSGLVVGALVACAIVGAIVWPEHSVKRTLAGGTVLVLSGVKIGRTNAYTYGTLWSKTIGRFAPSNGLAIAGLKLRRPEKVTVTGQEGSEVLSAQLIALTESTQANSLASPPFYRKYRWSIYGEDEFTFIQEFNDRRAYGRIFPSLRADSFPRDAPDLHFRLEERDSPETGNWREVTTFTVRNPKPARIQPWQPQTAPHLKLAEGLEVDIGELTVRREPIHPRDIWAWLGSLPVRVTQNGVVATNWGIHSGPVWDASGNRDYFTFSKTITNDWMVYRIFRPLDPRWPWRFRVHFALDSDFPRTNLFAFTIPWPLTGLIKTNLAGFPTRITSVNQNMLSVQLLSKPEDRRLTFIGAVDDAGTDLNDFSGSWGQHSFWKSLKTPSSGQVHATVAIHADYPAEFTLQPRYIRPRASDKGSTISEGAAGHDPDP